MKKVDEGVELFDDIWEKVYSAEQQNQKEKYEMDLKKEIKKLQRLRDQIKTWISSSDVKDKEPLLEARRLIETKMEQFKICEKETKTKTYSKEGLARQERLDPAEQAKQSTTEWIGVVVERLQTLADEAEVEIERLSAGKGKKTNKHLIDDLIHYIAQHKHHISKLEGIMRLVNNDVLDVDIVDPIKEDLEYYMDSFKDEDYQQAYDEEFFYEALGLDELDVVNVDRVTQAAAPPSVKKKEDSDNQSNSTKGSTGDKKSKKSVSSVIPLTIGRARVTSGSSKGKSKKEGDDESEKTPKKREPTPTTIPAARPAPPAPPAGGASMAAILKRETEQQEKERQKVRTGGNRLSVGWTRWQYLNHPCCVSFSAGTSSSGTTTTTATGASGSAITAAAATTATASSAARSSIAPATTRDPSSTAAATATIARGGGQAKGVAATTTAATGGLKAATASATRGSSAPTSASSATAGSSRGCQGATTVSSQQWFVSIQWCGWSRDSVGFGRIIPGRIGCVWWRCCTGRWIQLLVSFERVVCYHA